MQGRGKQPIDEVMTWCARTGWTDRHTVNGEPATEGPADTAPGPAGEEIDLRDPNATGASRDERDGPAPSRRRRWPRPDVTRRCEVPASLFLLHARHDPDAVLVTARSGARSPG